MTTKAYRRRAAKLFGARRGQLDYRVKRDYVRNGVVSIPCRVSSFDDVISPYSVKGLETLNPDFVSYLKEMAEATPDDLPLVLNVTGDCLSQAEQETVRKTVLDDFAYDLGIVEKEERRHTQIFAFMFVILVLVGVLLALSEGLSEVPRELIFIMFWFAGDTLVDYVLLTGHDLRRARRLAGRLASVKVVFSESFENTDYTEGNLDGLISEIEADVRRGVPGAV